MELSHEIDLAQYMGGEIDTISIKCSDFYGDIELKAQCDIVHSSGIRSKVVLDMTSSGERRSITIKGNYERTFDYGITDSAYLSQLRYFFRNINNQNMMNNLDEASGLLVKMLDARGQW